MVLVYLAGIQKILTVTMIFIVVFVSYYITTDVMDRLKK
jgi:hypothetical protein